MAWWLWVRAAGGAGLVAVGLMNAGGVLSWLVQGVSFVVGLEREADPGLADRSAGVAGRRAATAGKNARTKIRIRSGRKSDPRGKPDPDRPPFLQAGNPIGRIYKISFSKIKKKSVSAGMGSDEAAVPRVWWRLGKLCCPA